VFVEPLGKITADIAEKISASLETDYKKISAQYLDGLDARADYPE